MSFSPRPAYTPARKKPIHQRFRNDARQFCRSIRHVARERHRLTLQHTRDHVARRLARESDSLAGPLTGAELTGIISHEVAHTYFTKEMIEAREAKDKNAMKIVELKCDALAVLSLVLLGFDSSNYITGLRKREQLAKTVGLSSKFAPTHPDVAERAQFIKRFQKLLANVK